MLIEKRKAEADSAHYSVMREAEAMKERLSEPFLRYTLFTALANTTKIYFGEKIPTIFLDLMNTPQLTEMRSAAAAVATEEKKPAVDKKK